LIKTRRIESLEPAGAVRLKPRRDGTAGQPVMFSFKPAGKTKIQAVFLEDKGFPLTLNPASVALKYFLVNRRASLI